MIDDKCIYVYMCVVLGPGLIIIHLSIMLLYVCMESDHAYWLLFEYSTPPASIIIFTVLLLLYYKYNWIVTVFDLDASVSMHGR